MVKECMRLKSSLTKLFYPAVSALTIMGIVDMWQEHVEEQSVTEIGPWTINIDAEIDEEMANYVIEELQALNALNPDTPINIHFNSRGGYVTQGNRIIEAINQSENPVRAVCRKIDSMAFIIFATADFEKRYVRPECEGIYHLSFMPITYSEEELNAGAPKTDKVTLPEIEAYLRLMNEQSIDEITDMKRAWEYTISRRFAESAMNNLERTHQEFIMTLAASSDFKEQDIRNLGYADVNFNAYQLLWSGIADEYIGFESPLKQTLAEQEFCAQHNVSICHE